MNVVALSLDRNTYNENSRVFRRMQKYAEKLQSYHIIVLTRKEHGVFKKINKGNLYIYPTNSYSKLGMLVDAYHIGKSVLQSGKEHYVISSQDPFETGLVGTFLCMGTGAINHIQVHGDFYGNQYWKRESFFNKLRYHLGLVLLRRAACVRVVSERVRKSLIDCGIKASKISVVPIFSDLHTFVSTPDNTQNKEIIEILYVGRLAPEKNISMLIRSFSRAHETHSHIHLTIIGEGKMESELKELVKRENLHDSVSILPWTDDVAFYMQRSDILALTSNYEGYGMVLQEALVCGLPIITTDVGCVGEIVINDVQGLVVPPQDEKKLYHALCEMIDNNDKRTMYARNAKKKGEELLFVDEDTHVRKWVAALRVCERKL